MKRIKTLFYFVRYCLCFPLVFPSVITYLLALCDKTRLNEDIDINYKRLYQKDCASKVAALYKLMCDFQVFRNIFYYRSKPVSLFFKFLLRENKSLRLYIDDLGGGIYVQHGTSTIINAKSVGRNFFVNQNVTVGWRTDSGNPIIGDNVRIGTGATVLGNITIGDNVKIAAGAHIIKDIPSNSIVVPSPSIIYKIDGKTTNIVL